MQCVVITQKLLSSSSSTADIHNSMSNNHSHTPDKIKVYVLNTGGTLGSVGKPLRPAKSAAELMDGINVPAELDLMLADFKFRQDSSNILHTERLLMARQIAEVYKDY